MYFICICDTLAAWSPKKLPTLGHNIKQAPLLGRIRGGLANFTPIAGMGNLISEPKLKIPTPPLLISDKSLIMNNVYRKSINPQGAYLLQTHLSGDGLIQYLSKMVINQLSIKK